jgi:hypothetical protein
MTVKYLFEELIDQYDSLDTIHHFLWDRTRAIRNDFSIQQLTKTPDVRKAIESLEYIARFHILSLHEVGGRTSSPDTYDWQQDREQLDRTLLSLMHYYDDVRERYRSPHEVEFRAYSILFQLRNPTDNLEHRVQTWPDRMSEHPAVKTALALYAAASDLINARGPLQPAVPLPIAQENWDRFWKIVSSDHVPYLMACVCEIQFNHIRRGVLNSIWYAFRLSPTRGTEDWTLENLGNALYFEEEEDTQAFVEHQGFAVKEKSDGTPYVDLTSVQGQLPDPSPGYPSQTFSYDPVEKKRLNRNFSAVLSGRTVKEAEAAGQLEEELHLSGFGEPARKEMKEESLFVTGHSDDEEEQTKATGQPTTFGGFGQPSFPTAPTPTTQPAQPNAFGGFGQPSFPPTAAPTAQEAPKSTGAFSSPQTPANSFMGRPASSTTPAASATPAFAGFRTPSATSNSSAAFAGFGQPSNNPPTNESPIFGAPTATPSPETRDAYKAPIFQFKPDPSSSRDFVSGNSASTESPATEVPKPSLFNFSSTSFPKPTTTPPTPALAPASSPFNFGKSSATTFGKTEKAEPSSFGKLPGGFSNPSIIRGEIPKTSPGAQLPAIQLTPPQDEKQQSSQPPAFAAKPSLFQFPVTSTPSIQSSSSEHPTSSPSVTQPGQSTSIFNFQRSTTTTAQSPTFADISNKPTTQLLKDPTVSESDVARFDISPKPRVAQPSQHTPPSVTTAPSFAKSAPSTFKPAPPSQSTQPSSDIYRPPNEEGRKAEAMCFLARQMLLNPHHGFLKQYINMIAAPIVEQELTKRQAEDDAKKAGQCFHSWTYDK